MKDLPTATEAPERAILVGLITPAQNEARAKEYLDELEFLADTAGAVTVRKFTQKMNGPDSRTFVGSGKLEEIRQYNEDNDIAMAIFDDDLSSKQVANIEKELKIKVLTAPDSSSTYSPSAHARPTHAHRWNWPSTSICCRGSHACGPTSNASVAA